MCTALRGGLFDQSAMPNFKEMTSNTNGDGASEANHVYGTDSIKFGKTSIEDWDLDILLGNRWAMNGFGLNRGSKMLHRLKNEGYIPSRSFSLWWGQQGTESKNQMDGNLVFGGIDQARIKSMGNNYTDKIAPLDNPCPTGLEVSVTDISMLFANGTNTSIFGSPISSTKFCIFPGQHWVQLPMDAIENFMDLSGGSYAGRTSRDMGGLLFNSTGMFVTLRSQFHKYINHM